MKIINKIITFIKSTSCPQCKSRKIVKKKIIKDYIPNYNKESFYCCNCGFNFDNYKEIR